MKPTLANVVNERLKGSRSNNQINEEYLTTENASEYLEKVNSMLPELEKEINSILKTKIELQAKIQQSGQNRTIRIFSEGDEKELKGTIAYAVFKEINLSFWGGNLNGDGDLVFVPKVSYEHWSGGSNGTDFIWVNLFLQLNGKKPQWKYGRKLL